MAETTENYRSYKATAKAMATAMAPCKVNAVT